MNFVFIILDSLRRDHCGFHGNEWIHTPNLDALAGQSVIFESAFPESLPTLPVRRALHTGHRTFPFRNWEPEKGDNVLIQGWQRIPEEQYTVAEVMRQAGYTTAFVTDTYHQFKPSRNYARGFDIFQWIRGQERDRWLPKSRARAEDLERYVQKPFGSTGVHDLLVQYLANMSWRQREEDYLAPRVFQAGMEVLEGLRESGPFYMLIDSFDPHEPWDPPAWYVDLYDPGYEGKEFITPMYGQRSYVNDAELKHMRALYAGEVTLVDKWVGHFLNKLGELGLAEDTFVALVSDHGHALGEHDIIGKVPRELWPELVDIPLLLRHPKGARAGQRVEDFVYNHDLPATIYGLAGIEPPAPVEGVDLWQVAEGAPTGREYITTAFNDYCKIRTRKWACIIRGDGQDARLWDLESDPDWRSECSASHPEVVADLYAKLLEDAGGPLPDYSEKRNSFSGAWYTV